MLKGILTSKNMSDEIEGFGIESMKEEGTQNVVPKKKTGGGFQSFGFSLPILKGLLKRGYKIPTPIQRKSIPLILQGRDVVAMARTGSGKTACFLLPMFEKLLKRAPKRQLGVRALILSPTRELALQTVKFVRELGKFTNLKVFAVLGGESMDYQFDAIHNNPDIIVATPGRFLHVCIEMNLMLTSVEYVVFDEADRLFEMGFGEQLKEILSRLGAERQTVLFSATLPKLLVDFAKAGLVNPALLRLDVDNKIPDTLDLAYFSVKQDEKLASLLCLLNTLPTKSQTLIFVATKHHVEYLHMILDKSNISNTYIYSDLDPSARKIHAGKFQNKVCSVLIVTDVAARGVDIPHLDYVINYHFPAKSKLFVHRVGRCARAGRIGTAFSLVSSEEVPYVLDLHLFLGKKLNLIEENNKVKKENSDGAFGKIPAFLVESQQTDLIDWHQCNDEINSLQNVCSNGYKKYLRSRPGASVESVKRAKDINMNNLGIHYFFRAHCNENGGAAELLAKMKKYKPKGTIFELNLSNKSKCYSVMKKTKKAHERHVISHKKKVEENEKETAVNSKEDAHGTDDVVVKKEEDAEENEGENGNTRVFSTKRKKKLITNSKEKKRKTISGDYYVPHFAPDEHTEKGLSINSFTCDANRLTLDLTGDCDKDLKLKRKMKIWDKKRKKMVCVSDQKVGKIQTESGNWISASYKGDRYEKWKQKTNSVRNDDDDDDDDVEDNENKTKSKIFKHKDFPNTNKGRHNRKIAEKLKAKAGLLKPEKIFKARLVQEKNRQKNIPRKIKRMNKGKGKQRK